MKYPLMCAVVAALALACIDREVALVPPEQTREQQHDIPLEINRKLDLLFVIDDSGSMAAEQASLVANFPRFIRRLERIEGGLPDVHIGVISTNMGCGGNDVGDDGVLQDTPSAGCSVAPPTDRFIVDIADGAGGRTRNYPGDQTLADTFACIAELGTTGCGFEQPLASMRRALTNPANAGFLRDDALLGVVFITDEDDCSAFDPALFGGDQDAADAPLGFLHSFRCFEFGVQCEPDAPREPGVKENCAPRASSSYLTPATEYIDFLRELEGDGRVILAGIVGDSAPVRVETFVDRRDDREKWRLAKSCNDDPNDDNRGAVPAIRLEAVLDAFGARSQVTSICDEDLSDALDTIAALFAKVIGTPCLRGALFDLDPAAPGVQPDCAVSLVTNAGTSSEDERPLPACDDGATEPCYVIEPDPEACADEPTQLALRLVPEDGHPPGTHLRARCLLR